MDTRDIYIRVIRVVEYFVNNAAHLSVSQLQDYNPSVEQIAKDVHQLAGIIRALATDEYSDANMAINALQCCFELERLAIAVRNQREDELADIFKKLEMHINVP